MRVREKIQNFAEVMTPSERKLASAILADYPYSGLASIQELAEKAEVSAPSISRFVTKIGLEGYPELQRMLIEELRQGERSPVEIHESGQRIQGGYLAEFINRAANALSIAPDTITEAQFEKACAILSDPRRSIYCVGGRISDTIAQQFSFHLRQTRQKVYHLPRDAESWPEYLLRTQPGDIFFMADFRRYQKNTLQLAKYASQKHKIQIILMTDKWLSPATRYANEVLAVPTDTGTIWDSYSAAVAVVEAIVTNIAERDWDRTRKRIEAWDAARQFNYEDDK